MKFNYCNPVSINFDVNFIDILKEKIKTDSVLLITSNTFNKNGIVDVIRKNFNLVDVIYDIQSNPNINNLFDFKKKLESYEEIIALGGGSVMDASKYFSVISDIKIKDGDLVIKDDTSFKPIYAIPTTSGTSSELTKWAAFWDFSLCKKYSLMHNNLYPKEAIYDIKFYISLSKDLTLYTALDAFSHSIESIWNKNNNPISTSYAIKSIELILEFLPKLIENLNSIDYRKKISLAGIYSGLAFSNTQTALAHAISYPLTMKKNIKHGLACSFIIPSLLDCLQDKKNKELLMPYKKDIINMYRKLGISLNLKDYLDKELIEFIFSSLNSRSKNALFDLEYVKKYLLKNLI